jgi:L-threonylcarbamoyladenylate synthase
MTATPQNLSSYVSNDSDDSNTSALPHHDNDDDDSHKMQVHYCSNGETRQTKARIVSPSMLQECGARLRSGDLVAFPTETVYGLGCNALDESAIMKVFHAKERPLTDPLISHVSNPQTAYQLWHATASDNVNNIHQSAPSLEAQAIHALTQQFWPGPLTLVAKAAAHVPSIVMAGTGFCACRSPSHALALELIEAAQVPIAAPSANKFGHVSPTTAQHVWDDLLYEDVWIVKQEEEENEEEENIDEKTSSKTTSCEIGVESSVAKIEMITTTTTTTTTTTPITEEKLPRGKITLLRQGAISANDIQACLQSAGLADHFQVVSHTHKATKDTVSNVAPGQTIRHYSPNVPSFMVSHSLYTTNELDQDTKSRLSTAVVIDFGGTLRQWQPLCMAYRDLSDTGNSAQATQQVFRVLRWAEQVDGATSIFFPEIHTTTTSSGKDADALTLALKDRLTRAASGVVLHTLEQL